MRVSSRGNPWHDKEGKFCHGPEGGAYWQATHDSMTEEERQLASQREVIASEKEDYSRETQNRKLKETCSFVPAKSIEEAEAFTRSLGVEPRFNGFTLTQCNIANRVLQETLVEFPQVKITVLGNSKTYDNREGMLGDLARREMYYARKGIDQKKARTLAEIEIGMKATLLANNSVCIPKTGEVYINPNGRVREARVIDKITDSMSDCYKGNSFLAQTYHEFGHMIAYYYSPDEGKEFSEQFSGFKVRHGLSRYADFSHAELMAEGWAEYRMSENPRKIALAVGEYLRGLKNE